MDDEDTTAARVRSIDLGTEPLFDLEADGDGTYERTTPDGTVVTATVVDGRITDAIATARDGTKLTTLRLQMTSGEPDDAGDRSTRERCFFCFCDNNHCQCTPERCPDPPR